MNEFAREFARNEQWQAECLPPPLMMDQPGSFAHLTLTQRWPAIVQRIIRENSFTDPINQALETLIGELFDGRLRQLRDEAAPDSQAWVRYLEPLVGTAWLEVPWFFAEVYFYRRILEAIQYFQSAIGDRLDPFLPQKQAGLASALADLRAMSQQVEAAAEAAPAQLIPLLYSVLWGNRADLSLRPEETATGVQDTARAQREQSHLLVDQTPLLQDYWRHRLDRVDLVADNAGFELGCDLLLIDFLLTHRLAAAVNLHLKAHPTFVSDATIADVDQTLQTLKQDADPGLNRLGERLSTYLGTGQLGLRDDFFWTSPLPLWEAPAALRQELSAAALVLVKGDANYRRLLGDRQWDFTTPFSEILRYAPTKLVALRTLKSELVAGLQPQQIERLHAIDPQWLTNGNWGVIQLSWKE